MWNDEDLFWGQQGRNQRSENRTTCNPLLQQNSLDFGGLGTEKVLPSAIEGMNCSPLASSSAKFMGAKTSPAEQQAIAERFRALEIDAVNQQ